MKIKKTVSFIFIFSIISFLINYEELFAQEIDPILSLEKPSKKEVVVKDVPELRSNGDIYLGFEMTGGLGLINPKTVINGASFHNKNHFYYGIGFQAEFFFSPYFSLIVGTAAQYYTFTRYNRYPNGDETIKKTYSYSQWFHQMKLTARIYYWDFLYLQTGMVLLGHYGSKLFKVLSGVGTNINDRAGVLLQWQFGLGASVAIGDDNSNSFDFGLNFLLPIAGNLINNEGEDAGGTKIRLKGRTVFTELFIGTNFKL